MAKKKHYFMPSSDMKLGDSYLLLEQLGDGTHGWVWRAQRIEDNEIVAVKIPKDCSASDSSLREGHDLLDTPSHPNVIQIYKMGRIPPEREWYGIEMEYFPSRSLAQLLEDTQSGFAKTYKQIFEIYEQVLLGVKHLATLEKPVSHGDLKPHNILISGDQVKLTDFGSSALPEEIYARSRQNGGTVLYSAPEFADCSDRRGSFLELIRGDMYSLGVLMYQLVTGRPPHDTPSAVYRSLPYAKPSELNKTVSPRLEHFIAKALSIRPDERWSDIDGMIRDLKVARIAQLNFEPRVATCMPGAGQDDWSSRALSLIEDEKYVEAAQIAKAEFDSSKDYHALLAQLRALYRGGRYFECVKSLRDNKNCLALDIELGIEFRELALGCFLKAKDVLNANKLIEEIESRGELIKPEMVLKKASVYGLQSRYDEAIELLVTLNRQFPRRAFILRRLALAYEQVRQPEKALAYLKTYCKVNGSDDWTQEKIEYYNRIGYL
ncbi:protein kinase domain-containing protein [Vibrio cyclitrophicus]|uniref:serine/threonine-protein kinase n=1 Tax=Vibrio cyclitrophicus TaxID=47951 RepID=UPI001F53CF1B|nr:serine/threonine-protein kinase [Vibrio cyclitrophicus]